MPIELRKQLNFTPILALSRFAWIFIAIGANLERRKPTEY